MCKSQGIALAVAASLLVLGGGFALASLLGFGIGRRRKHLALR
jgi:hypothetical protein